MRTLNRDAADVAAPFAPERRHRRDGLRPARARVRDGRAQRRPDRARRGARFPRCPARSSSPRPGCAPAATGATASTPEPHVESTAADAHEALAFDPQTAGGLLVSLPADKARRARGRRSPTAGLDLFRIGRVEDGAGVTLGERRCEVGGRPRRRRSGARAARCLGSPVRPARRGDRVHALGRRHERRRRAAHRLRARLRQLAALRRQAVSREGRPCCDRVRQPGRGARRRSS